MTVTTTNIENVSLGNGSVTVFPFTFRYTLASQIVVEIGQGSAAPVRLNTSQYVVTPGPNLVGGSVQILSGAPPVGAVITIRRVLPLTQDTSIGNEGPFLPETVMTALDRGVMQAQQLGSAVENSLRVPDGPVGLLPNRMNRAGRLVGFDEFGEVIVTTTVEDFDAPIDVATRAAETAVAAAESAVAARTAVAADSAQALAAAGVAIPAAALAQTLAANWSEVVSPTTVTPEAYLNSSGGPYDLGDVLPLAAPFTNERLPNVRIDLARGGGGIIDLGSVA